jgi:hypothetical protein
VRSAADFRQAAHARRDEIEAELAEVRRLQERHEAERATLAAQRAEVLARLAAAVLPGLNEAAFERAARLTGFVAGRQQDPIAAMQAEARALQERIAAIEADERYVKRELLAAPRTGELQLKIAELEEFRAPAAEVVARGAHPRFRHLLDVGYGTDAYKVPFWRLSYYRDWKAGDEIVAEWPGKETFAAVREEYLTAAESLATFDASLAPLRQQVADIAGLEQDLADKQQLLETLPDRHLGAWRQRLVDHLQSLDPAWLADRLAGEQDVELLFKQADGLLKKAEYLDAVAGRQAAEHRAALVEEDRALKRDLDKLARPKNAGRQFPDDKFQKRFVDRPARMRKLWQRTSRTYDTVYVFDRWDRGRLVDDFLWWDLMTDGRLDGNFIPDVQRFHTGHPDYAYDRHRGDDDDAAAAAAVAASEIAPPEAHGLLDAS